ncbi:hypothetical protein HD806DRAFT_545300 [Xylariaceae sp. AK1471]|nr:hypothetical protein HD806DRAFT_545300 [Xylariaceae sp. AK1471]
MRPSAVAARGRSCRGTGTKGSTNPGPTTKDNPAASSQSWTPRCSARALRCRQLRLVPAVLDHPGDAPELLAHGSLPALHLALRDVRASRGPRLEARRHCARLRHRQEQHGRLEPHAWSGRIWQRPPGDILLWMSALDYLFDIRRFGCRLYHDRVYSLLFLFHPHLPIVAVSYGHTKREVKEHLSGALFKVGDSRFLYSARGRGRGRGRGHA